MPELVLGVIAVISIALFGREFYLRKKSSSDEAEINKTFRDLNDVAAKSRELLGETQIERKKLEEDFDLRIDSAFKSEEKTATELITQTKQEFTKVEDEFTAFLNELKAKTETQQSEALAGFTKYLEDLKLNSKNSEVANMKGASERVNQLFENFETKLADFLLQSEQKMMLAVDLELRSARQLIDTYKVQQMNLIDENIVAMLEKTLSLVLAKNLNLKDQMDLVYESLEKAKVEKFIL